MGLICPEVHCFSTISPLLNTDFLILTLSGPFLCSSLQQNSKRVKHTSQVCLCPTILQFSTPKSPVTSPSQSMGLQTSPSQSVIQCFLIANRILACHPHSCPLSALPVSISCSRTQVWDPLICSQSNHSSGTSFTSIG